MSSRDRGGVLEYRAEACRCLLAVVRVVDGELVLEVQRLAEGRPGPNGNPRSRSAEGFTVPLDRFTEDELTTFAVACPHNRMYPLGSNVPDDVRAGRRGCVAVAPIG